MKPHYKKLFFAVLFSVISTALFSQKVEIKNHTQLSYRSNSSEFTINLDMSVDEYPDAELTYTSSSSLKHAIIDGKLYVDGFGDVTVTASCKNHSDVNTQTFTFSFIRLNENITFLVSASNTIKYIGDSCKISIIVRSILDTNTIPTFPASNLTAYNYSSTDNSVITVDSNGLVKAVGVGNATININCNLFDVTKQLNFTIAEKTNTFKYFTSSSLTIMKGKTVSLPIDAEFDSLVTTIDTQEFAEFADIDFVNKTIKAKREGVTFTIAVSHLHDNSIELLNITVLPDSTIRQLPRYFNQDTIDIIVGQTIKLPISSSYPYPLIKQVTIMEPNSILIGKFNRTDSTVTGISAGEYTIIAQINDSILDKVVIIITEPVDTLNITKIKILNYGYTVEITFDKPIELYEGIEKDFTITYENSTPLKSNNSYEVKKVMAKTGDPYTLVLTFDTPVPSSNIMVSFKEDVSFTASSVSVVTDGTIKTYPIPASDNITIEAEGLKSVEILSINGDIISKFMVNENVFTISIKTLPIGLYFIKAETNTGCVTKTIEKK